MKKISVSVLSLILMVSTVIAQTPQPQEDRPDDVVRISTALVQTDVVVTDKNDRVINDLKLSDFEVYENGKRQDVKFMEFVGLDTGLRTEGARPAGLAPAGIPAALPPGGEIPRDLSAGDLKRVMAFVVDDLTIPLEDMATVRKLLQDFVDTQMKEGDLVAVVRVVGGKGLLQQFTSDKQLLRRAIAALNVTSHPFAAFNNPAPERRTSAPTMVAPSSGEGIGGVETAEDADFEDFGLQNANDPNDETQRLLRGYFSLTTANSVIESLKEIPGRKSMVLISGGIPIFETASAGTSYSNVSYLLQQLTDNAVRAGVVVNTMDPRGLKATPGVVSFLDTPARSALGAAPDPNFGRGGSSAGRAETFTSGIEPSRPNDDVFGPPLTGASEHLGLATVANATGGVSVVNTNNFRSGLDKVLARSSGYYLLAYTPVDKFDNKFRRIEIKVKREGVRIYTHRGYMARVEKGTAAARTKEQTIMAAAKSPIAKRDIDVSANFIITPAASGKNSKLGIHMLIDANKLNFTQSTDGKYQTSFDVVGFVYDQFGRVRGGFSETVNTNISPELYKEALRTGLVYSANTELPPGYFQVRTAVREASTGSLGTVSRYLEIPNVSSGKLTMSSIFIFAADPAQPKGTPQPLLALRQISRKQDLRYAAQIFNAKTSGGKGQLRTQLIISQAGNVLFKEPEQPLEVPGSGPVTKIGQIGLSKVSPGRYVLTLVVTDPEADKKNQIIARSIDFTVVN